MLDLRRRNLRGQRKLQLLSPGLRRLPHLRRRLLQRRRDLRELRARLPRLPVVWRRHLPVAHGGLLQLPCRLRLVQGMRGRPVRSARDMRELRARLRRLCLLRQRCLRGSLRDMCELSGGLRPVPDHWMLADAHLRHPLPGTEQQSPRRESDLRSRLRGRGLPCRGLTLRPPLQLLHRQLPELPAGQHRLSGEAVRLSARRLHRREVRLTEVP